MLQATKETENPKALRQKLKVSVASVAQSEHGKED